jgi:hypothetical protein
MSSRFLSSSPDFEDLVFSSVDDFEKTMTIAILSCPADTYIKFIAALDG